ncbi:general transcription factor IIF subunit 2-like [Procambarus clarkii]|uniref:general transcription factor IIF subunit 2-like n=1 Tax=Procambarus clarkii TaxID=6728 RepID=UPI001E671825|nr:general transcription factor IIF subunit 2-like [Procambarus clarkii]
MSQQSKTDLDITNSSRGVWLVKVPKYLGNKWADCAGHDVGKLEITKVPGKPSTVTLKSSEHTLKDCKIPREHTVISHSLKGMRLGIFSQPVRGNSSDAAVPETQKLCFEGQVVEKVRCQPVVDDYYINLKKEAKKKAAQPLNKAKLIDSPVNVYKPTSHHEHDVHLKQRKAVRRMVRDDKDKVMELLFAAFEKHQYYYIKDLRKITQQPITYLKEILRDLCNYNVKNPHKNMWGLKPEYHYYKPDE